MNGAPRRIAIRLSIPLRAVGTYRRPLHAMLRVIDCGLAHGAVFSNPPKDEELVRVPQKYDDCRPWEAMVG
jgi:hypothetical protein